MLYDIIQQAAELAAEGGVRIEGQAAQGRGERGADHAGLGWHYSSNATCPIRPRLFYVCSSCRGALYLATSFATFEESLC